jgi:hypothetical protein
VVEGSIAAPASHNGNGGSPLVLAPEAHDETPV